MTEPAGIPSVLGIESVDWLAEGGENLTVRVTGRWRRRRPGWSMQPVLVVEAAGRRFRFPAMPEPPSLSGAGPGMWRISFSVPAALAPELGGRTWLQVGAVVIPLPAAGRPLTDVSNADPGGPSAAAQDLEAGDQQVAASPPSPELEVEGARRRAREAEEAAREAEEEVEGLVARVRGLEEELSTARAEAESLGDRVSEAELAEPLDTAPAPGIGGKALRLERALVAREDQRRSRVLDEPPPIPAASPRLREAPESGPAAETLVPALRRELKARAAAEAALRARLVEAEAKLGARTMLERRTSELLGQLGQELEGLRGAFQRERSARRDAERRAEELVGELAERRRRIYETHASIAELREALEGVRRLQAAEPAVAPGAPAAEPTVPSAQDRDSELPAVEAERLNDARQRLREAVAPSEAIGPSEAVGALLDAERTERAWLAPIWRRLASKDPDLAGRLLVELLPAQREVLAQHEVLAQGGAHSQRLAYDLVFPPPRGCARVTVTESSVTVSHDATPRPAGDVDLQVFGDASAIARLLTAGPLRRRFGRGVARVRGRRAWLVALSALPAVRLDLHGLHRLGVGLDPELAMVLVALMIDPAWTGKERFAVGYLPEGRAPVYLLIRDGEPPAVSGEAPAGGVVATIAGPAEAAALVLAGERAAEVKVTGEDWPLALVRKWIKRAQSG